MNCEHCETDNPKGWQSNRHWGFALFSLVFGFISGMIWLWYYANLTALPHYQSYEINIEWWVILWGVSAGVIFGSGLIFMLTADWVAMFKQWFLGIKELNTSKEARQ